MHVSGQQSVGVGMRRREHGTRLRHAAAPAAFAQPFVILTDSEATDAPTEWAPHTHAAHELVWVRGGSMTSRVDRQLFAVPVGVGLWIPAGRRHAGRVTAGAQLNNSFFAVDQSPVTFRQPTVIEMTPLLGALLERLEDASLGAAERARTEAVVFDTVRPSRQPLALPLPDHSRLAPIVAALLDDPGDRRPLQDWAAVLRINPRTITRWFRDATGLPFASWRHLLRLLCAVHLLSEGVSVRAVAEALGYTQSSTFIAAFRTVTGVTPGRLLASLHVPDVNVLISIPAVAIS